MPRPKKERRSEGPRFTVSKGWVARVWEQDGGCSGWLALGTTDREHAKKLLTAWVRTGVRPAAKKGEGSFADEAEDILRAKEEAATTAREKRAVKYRRSRLLKYAMPSLGPVPVGLIEPSHIAGVLDAMAEQGVALRSIHNLRSDISVILAKLVRKGELKMNPATDLALPEEATVDTRERMHLSDEQMITFQTRRGFASPLDMCVLLCRCVGGERTSDLHAGDWGHVDLEHFAWMRIRRPKTDGQVGQRVGQRKSKTKNYEYVIHTVHEQYRPAVRAYWEAQGKPTSGPLFPLLRDAVATPMKLGDGTLIERQGGKAGERKGRGTSYAKALRRAVWEEQLYSPLPGFDPDAPDKKFCAFQTDTETTRRLTFHGLRADLNSALMEAGATDDQRILIMGHTQASTGHKHYMRQVLVEVPDSALPGVSAAPREGFPPEIGRKPLAVARVVEAKSMKSVARPGRFERPTFGSVEGWSPSEASQTPTNTTATGELANPSEGVSSQTLGGNESPRQALLAAAARAAMSEDWAQLDRVRAALLALDGPAKLTLVPKLSDVRSRK